MIFIFSTHKEYPNSAADIAVQFANASDRSVCFTTMIQKKETDSENSIVQKLSDWSNQLSPQTKNGANHQILHSLAEFDTLITNAEASMLVIELSENEGFNKVKPLLKMCRNLRIPYIFTKPYFEKLNLNRVIVPITFLIEDREKGPFASSLGRFFNSELLFLTAKDYGHKAIQTTNAIKSLLDKFQLKYQDIQATKNSHKVELEATLRTTELNAGMVIISASREYGLDDILFGPKEFHIINEAGVPIMLLNPRSDLYVLCG